MILDGLILVGEDLEPISGYIAVEEGTIVEVVDTGHTRSSSLIIPGFVNCHTHVGDYLFKDRGMGLSLDELVKSPNGLKHVLLSESDPEEQVRGMAAAEEEMIECGTTSFLDFREQGLDGVRSFRRAISRIRGLVFGRPKKSKGIHGEVSKILKEADGIGLESVGAYDDDGLRSIRDAADGRMVGVHMSEGRRVPGEMERALNILEADILVHLTCAMEKDLRTMAEKGKRAVLCPRSNLCTGVGLPPVDLVMDQGMDVGLGTDNCMINSLNIFREMEVALSIMDRKRPRDVLKMATIGGARVAGIPDETGSIEVGKAADITVLDVGINLKHTQDVHTAIVKRAGPNNVALVLGGGQVLLDRRKGT